MEVEPGRGSVDAEIRERSFLAQTLGSNPTEGWGGSSAQLDLSTGVGTGEGARPAPASAAPPACSGSLYTPRGRGSGSNLPLQPLLPSIPPPKHAPQETTLHPLNSQGYRPSAFPLAASACARLVHCLQNLTHGSGPSPKAHLHPTRQAPYFTD